MEKAVGILARIFEIFRGNITTLCCYTKVIRNCIKRYHQQVNLNIIILSCNIPVERFQSDGLIFAYPWV